MQTDIIRRDVIASDLWRRGCISSSSSSSSSITARCLDMRVDRQYETSINKRTLVNALHHIPTYIYILEHVWNLFPFRLYTRVSDCYISGALTYTCNAASRVQRIAVVGTIIIIFIMLAVLLCRDHRRSLYIRGTTNFGDRKNRKRKIISQRKPKNCFQGK